MELRDIEIFLTLAEELRLTPLGERLRDRLHTGYGEIMAGLERPSPPLAGRSAP